jgi:membrane-associated phospholipid phosphatase
VDALLLAELDGALGANSPTARLSPRDVVALVDPKPFALAAELLVAIALLRRRPRLAVSVGAVLVLANATSQVLKELLAAPRAPGVDAAAWPSGHATAAMSLAVCLLLVAPARFRRPAALAGGLFAAAVSACIVIAGDHLASDVVGGVLVAGAFGAAAVAALRLTDAHRARWSRPVAALRSPAALGLAALGAAVAALARADAVAAFAEQHTKFTLAAAAIAAGGLALAAVRSPRLGGIGRLVRAP